jgi:hypothetical protein
VISSLLFFFFYFVCSSFFTTDNAGPPHTAEEVLANAIALSVDAGRPDVIVVSSTLADYTDAVKADGAWSNLPVITQDLSDSWIWGVGSDPIKVQKMRALCRARTRCEAEDAPTYCGQNDTAYTNFSRLALKNMEHTWGVSVSHYGTEADKDWSNVDFHQQLYQEHEEHFELMVSSWVEQREWGLDYALEALPIDHPVNIYARQDIQQTEATGPPNPVNEGFVPITMNLKPIHLGGYHVVFDADTGGAKSLVDDVSNTEWYVGTVFDG